MKSLLRQISNKKERKGRKVLGIWNKIWKDMYSYVKACLLYTSDAADDWLVV